MNAFKTALFCFIPALLVFLPYADFQKTAFPYENSRRLDGQLKLAPVLQTGHIGAVNSACFSPDGKFVATGSRDGTAKLWEVKSAREIRTFRQGLSKTDILEVSFSPDGGFLVTRDIRRKNKIWEVRSGKDLLKILGIQSADSVSFSPANNYLAVARPDKVVAVWDVKTLRKIKELEIYPKVSCVRLSRDGKLLAIGGVDGTAAVFNTETGRKILDIKFDSAVSSVGFGYNGRLLAAYSDRKSFQLWNVHSQRRVLALDETTHHFFALNNSLLALSRNAIKTYRLDSEYETVQPAGEYEIKLNLLESIRLASLSPNSKYLAFVIGNNSLKIWDVHSEKLSISTEAHKGSYTTPAYLLPWPTSFYIASVAFSPDSRFLVTGGSDKSARLLDISTGKEIKKFSGVISDVKNEFAAARDDRGKTVAGEWELRFNNVTFSRDGNYLGIVTSDKAALAFNLNNFTEVTSIGSPESSVSSLAIDAGGKCMATGSFKNRYISLWDMVSKEELYRFEDRKDYNTLVAFSPDGQYLAAAGFWNEGPSVWNYAKRERIQNFRYSVGRPYALRFSHDSRRIILGGYSGKVAILDILSGQKVTEYTKHGDDVIAADFHPGNKVVATGGRDKSIVVFDLEYQETKTKLQPQRGTVYALSYSPDGEYLAAGFEDGTLMIYRTPEYDAYRTLEAHQDAITSIYYSPDGKYAASGSHDYYVKLWDTETWSEIAGILLIGKDDWAIFTPDNFYAASKGSLSALAFRLGTDIYPFEQFDLRFNRPDIIIQRIGKAPAELIDSYKKAYAKRLRLMNFTEEMLGDDFHLPEIRTTLESLPLTAENKNIRFQLAARDAKYLLDRINVYVNDVPIYGINGISLRGKKLNAVEKEISLELSDGRNKLQASVLNEKGAESLRDTFEITYNGESAKPDLYIVTIGVSEYADKRFNLLYASKDAQDLADLLARQSDRFRKIHPFVLLNEDVTKNNFIAVKDKLMKSGVDDEVVLFIAGHGLLDDNLDYYFGTHDIDFANPSEKGLPYETIERLLDGLPARKKLLLIDTCHAGEVDREETDLAAMEINSKPNVKSRSFRGVIPATEKNKLGLNNSFELMQQLFANLSRGSGAVVISAAGGVQFAFEDEKWQNGVFTYCILEGLKTKKADIDLNGEISVTELRNYVTAEVAKLTSGRQTPTSRRENLALDYRVY